MDAPHVTREAEELDPRLVARRHGMVAARQQYFWRGDAAAHLESQTEALAAQKAALETLRASISDMGGASGRAGAGAVSVVASNSADARAAKARAILRAERAAAAAAAAEAEEREKEKAERVARAIASQEEARKRMVAAKGSAAEGDGDAGASADAGAGASAAEEDVGVDPDAPLGMLAHPGTLLHKHTKEGKGKLHARTFVVIAGPAPGAGSAAGTEDGAGGRRLHVSWFRKDAREQDISAAVLTGVGRGLPPCFNWDRAKDVTRELLSGLPAPWQDLSLVLYTSVGPVYVVAPSIDVYHAWLSLCAEHRT